jgi:Bromodomain
MHSNNTSTMKTNSDGGGDTTTIVSGSGTSRSSILTASKQNHKLTNSQREALNRMYKMVQQFILMKDSVPFREPVNWKELELYDYPKIIKRMMDLGTIQNKIDNEMYANAAAIAYDMRLIWKNCMLYNAEGSDFYILARLYSKRFEDRYRRIRNECTYEKKRDDG